MKISPRKTLLLILSASILSSALVTGTALAQERHVLSGHVPKAAALITPIHRMAETNRLKLAIGLPLRNEQALDSLMRELYDPASPKYRQWQTPQQLAEHFGPSEADYLAVKTWATTHGLKVSGTHPNRVVLDVEGTVVDIEKALGVTMHVYNHPYEARTFHAPANEPSIESGVPILNISGLSDYALPRPNSHVKPLAETGTAHGPASPDAPSAQASPNLGSGPGGTYAGCDFRSAYAAGVSRTGAGQSVGLLQFDGYYPGDIANYASRFGLPYVNLINVPVDGGVDFPGDGNTEVCLDIEMVMSMAPGVSTIYVYEAPNPSPWVDLLNRMHQDNFVKQFSCSWAGGAPNATAENIFRLMAAAGQSFFTASGDYDAYTGEIPFPCDSPNITVVGGTTLNTSGSCGRYSYETVWNWGSNGEDFIGSAGGISPTYRIPTWQQGIDMSLNGGSSTMRNIPDVAMTADNVCVYCNFGDVVGEGGTSCAAPLWAGFMALVNEEAQATGNPAPGFINPALYAIGKGPNYSSAFHDVTMGDNVYFSGVTGYDLATGWGSPAGANLIHLLAITRASITIATNGCGTVSPNYNGQMLDLGKAYSMTAKPAAGFAFSSWSGSIPANSPTLSFTMQPNLRLIANFVDIQSPALSITTRSDQRLSNSVFTVTGKASDNYAVARVWYQLNGQNWLSASTADGWSDWSATMTLTPGLNTISAYAIDPAGNVSTTATISITYIASDIFHLVISGQGTVAPNNNNMWLQVGKTYSLNAVAASGCLFSNWMDNAGHVLTTSPSLQFVMRSNLMLRASFVPNPFLGAVGNYAGLFYVNRGDVGVTVTNAGCFSATLTKSGSFTAKLQLGASTYPIAGQFSVGGDWFANSLSAAPGLSLSLHLDTLHNVITGELRSASWTAELGANLNPKTSGVTAPGKYTLILPGSSRMTDAPAGAGFATLNVMPGGTVTLIGTLADGTKISQSSFVAQNGQFPLYSSLYAGKGLVLGWMTFTNDMATRNDLEGMVNWMKLPQVPGATTYTNGFTFGVANGIAAQGSFWMNTTPLLNFASGMVTFNGGNLPEQILNAISVDATGKVTDQTLTNGLSLAISCAAGTFSGTVRVPESMGTVKFSGVMHQKQGRGYGQFINAGQSGNVTISANR